MIIYLVKSTLLLGLLFGVYKLLLENEKTHRFNRFFLLFALIFGLTAPLISFEIQPERSIAGIKLQQMERVVNAPAEAVSRTVEPLIVPKQTQEALPKADVSPVVTEEPGWQISTLDVLFGVYGSITLFLLARFVVGLIEIRNKVKAGSHQETDHATLVLLDEPITPQSFLGYIFLEKRRFESGEIEPEILDHEITHIRQLHSLDVLFIEFLKVIFWFNPLMYLYKHAIQLNHEFLADESVVSNGSSVSDYQKTLIRVSAGNKPMNTTSSINYSLTQKRLKIMSSKLSIWRTFPKVLFSVSVFSILALISCTESKEWPDFMTWQEVYDRIPPITYNDVELESEGVTGILIGPNGEPYTGEQNTYSVDTDLVISKKTIIDGKVTRSEFPVYDSTGVYQYKSVTIPSLDSEGNKVTTSYTYRLTDSLVLISIRTENDSLITYDIYHPNGQIAQEFQLRPKFGLHGMATIYDEGGLIIGQRLYEDGELIEEIKEMP